MFDRLMGKESLSIINKIQETFSTLPHLPQGIVQFLLKIAPWLALLSGIIGLITGIALGISIPVYFSQGPMLLIVTVLTVIITIVNSVLLLYAFTPLKGRELKGWVFLFWSEALGIIESVLNIFHGGSAVGTIIGAIIILYVLYEIKPFYTGVAAVIEKVKKVTS